MATPGFADYSKSKHCPTKFRVIKDLLNAYDVKPNKSSKVEKPIQENYQMLETINEKHINIEGNSGIRTNGMEFSDYTRDNIDMYKGSGGEIIEAWAETNPSQNISQGLNGLTIDEKNYTHDFMNYEANTNHSVNNAQGLENINMQTGKFIQDAMQYEQNAGINPGYTFLGEMAQPEQERNFPVYQVESSRSDSRINRRVDHQNELHLERNLPQTSARAVVTKTENFNSMNISSRDYRLPATMKQGSFENAGIRPTFNRENPNLGKSGSSEKEKLRDYFNQQQFGRW
jgi:hypothetical protein